MAAILCNREVAFALVGGAAALVARHFREPAAARRNAVTRRRLPRTATVALLAAIFGGLCVHGIKEAVRHGPLSIRLQRQKIPLHEVDGQMQHKSAYHGKIELGGPTPQEFDVVFDTGSGHLVVPSSMCKSQTCMAHRRFKKSASLLAEDIDVDGTVVQRGQPRDQISISFGTGSVTGIFIRDKLCMGSNQSASPVASRPDVSQSSSLLQVLSTRGAVSEALSEDESEEDEKGEDQQHGCLDMRLVSAIEMSSDPFESFSFDGVFGLGLPGLSQAPDFNVHHLLAQSNAYEAMPGYEGTFAVFLATSDSEDSDITFGGYQPGRLKHSEAQFHWNSVHDEHLGYWQLQILSITANGEKLDYCSDGTCRGVVDTGTSLLAVPTELGETLYSRLQFKTTAGKSCEDFSGPRLEIELANYTIVLDPADVSRLEHVDEATSEVGVGQEEAARESTNNTSGEGHTAGGNCVPMIMYIDLPEPLSPRTLILGEPVLQKYYAVFSSRSPASVGFAEALHVPAVGA